LLLSIISPYVYKQAQEKNNGCGVGHVNVGDIKKFNVFIPPLSVQKEIVARLDKLSENVKRLEANYKQIIANCDELKKTILKQTFQGESE
jgi:type I restriction enzyme S subunit